MTERSKKTRRKRFCSECEKDTTVMHRGNKLRYGGYGVPYPKWRKDGRGGWLCHTCHMRNYLRKHRQKNGWYVKKYSIHGSNRIYFKGRTRAVNIIPRIGVCNFCRAVKGLINAQMDKLCKFTSIAHLSYHEDDILKDTIELCISCHSKYDMNVRKERKA
jgi:hypothetical protein